MSEMLAILALHEQGFSINEIARRRCLSKSTVQRRLSQLGQANISTEKAREMKPEDLKKTLLPPKRKRMDYFEPDWDAVYQKASNRRRGKNLKALWLDYCDDPNRSVGQKLLTYQAFCRIFKRYEKELPPKMHLLRLIMQWPAGEVVMADYAGDKLYLRDAQTGKEVPVYLFVSVLANSGLIFCKPTMRQTRDDWIDAMTEMFTFYGGVAKAIYLDNSTSLVLKADRFNPKVCDEFASFCEYYGTVPNPVAPGEPTYKGLVENAVKQCTARIIRVLRERRFFELSALEIEVKKLLNGINNAPMDDYIQQSRLERFEEERPYLRRLPTSPYEPSLIILKRKVQSGYVIRYEDCRYSVPYQYVGKEVRVLVRPRKHLLEIVDGETGEIITSHPLSERRGETFVRREHMPKAHQYVNMTNDERVAEIGSAGDAAKELALFIVRHETKATVYRHLQGLQNARKRLGDKDFVFCCEKALKHVVVGYEAFTKEEDQLLMKEQGKHIALRQGVRMTLPVENENIRGEAYFKEGE